MTTRMKAHSIKAILGAIFLGAAAGAATLPAAAQTVPSYASGTSDETIKGTIASIDGQYAITVRDQRGFIDNVSLHQGTIINPTGLTLAPGQSVSIVGHADGKTFAANEIDTPYAFVPALGYPYPYGYAYGFGYPAYSVGFGFHHFGFGFRG